ncbi:MAG: helix-turn-helix transcriptional regulator [Anaerotignum sp.]|nr:helix-turn-helix transcriptional regulator [Anaerotignum sp.]
MYNPIDEFSKKLREKREAAGQTQKGLAAKMGMSHRTIMDTELCRSSPKFETVALLAKELNISLDALVFHDAVSPNCIPKCVYDFFEDKTEAEAQKYIALCQQADTFRDDIDVGKKKP